MGAVLSDEKGRKMLMQLLLQRARERLRSVELQTWEMVILRLRMRKSSGACSSRQMVVRQRGNTREGDVQRRGVRGGGTVM